MKRFLALAAASFMLLSLSACTSAKQEPAEPAAPPAQSAEPAGQAAAPAEKKAAPAAKRAVSNYERAEAQGHLTGCKSNLKNIATGLEMWQSDHNGQCPKELEDLVRGDGRGGYLPRIYTCPASGTDTYSASYKVSADGKGFDLCCSGENHAILDVPKDRPAYNSTTGLIEK